METNSAIAQASISTEQKRIIALSGQNATLKVAAKYGNLVGQNGQLIDRNQYRKQFAQRDLTDLKEVSVVFSLNKTDNLSDAAITDACTKGNIVFVGIKQTPIGLSLSLSINGITFATTNQKFVSAVYASDITEGAKFSANFWKFTPRKEASESSAEIARFVSITDIGYNEIRESIEKYRTTDDQTPNVDTIISERNKALQENQTMLNELEITKKALAEATKKGFGKKPNE